MCTNLGFALVAEQQTLHRPSFSSLDTKRNKVFQMVVPIASSFLTTASSCSGTASKDRVLVAVVVRDELYFRVFRPIVCDIMEECCAKKDSRVGPRSAGCWL